MEKLRLDRDSARRAVLSGRSEEAGVERADERPGESPGQFLSPSESAGRDRVVLYGRKSAEQHRRGQECVLIGCNQKVLSKEMCNFHFLRWRRHGNPFAGRMPNGFYDLWIEQNVFGAETDECIIWPFGRDKKGYARLRGRTLVHQMACEHQNGPKPFEGAHAAHNCGKGSSGCVNPRHMEWKTPSGNERDKVTHGTDMRGTKHWNSKLTPEAVRFIRSEDARQFSNRELGKIFGVAPSCISRAKTGVDWAWLDD